MRLTTMLLLAAMAGASCTSNAKNNEENNNQERNSKKSKLKKAKQELLSFMLRTGKVYQKNKNESYWTVRHFRWLNEVVVTI